jgi:hypothetical protein
VYESHTSFYIRSDPFMWNSIRMRHKDMHLERKNDCDLEIWFWVQRWRLYAVCMFLQRLRMCHVYLWWYTHIGGDAVWIAYKITQKLI